MQLTMASIHSFLSSLSPNSPVKYHSRYHVLPQNANDMFSFLSRVLPEQFERESLVRTECRKNVYLLFDGYSTPSITKDRYAFVHMV